MPAEPTSVTQSLTREKQSVARTSVVVAGVLTALKVAVGVLTGSLGILSEAAHSALDLTAALATYFSVRVADLPADESHPFGHGKVENLSALLETALLLVTCALIVGEALRRLYVRLAHVKVSLCAYGVMLASMVVDTLRARALSRVARKYNSQALEADALHFSTDVYGSGVVVLGLVMVQAAERWKLSALGAADPIAALFVAGISIGISLRLGKRTVDALVDAAPKGVSDRITLAVSQVPGVLHQDRIRVRQSGGRLFVDLRLTLQSNVPLEHAQAVADSVEAKVLELFPTADVVVHATPRVPASNELIERIRAIANRRNYQVHDVSAYEVDGRVNVSLDLELDPGLRLDEAHGWATDLEGEIQREIREVGDVNIHLEPRIEQVESAEATENVAGRMERKLERVARGVAGVLDCHAVEAHQVGPSVVVSLHCTLDPDLPVTRVHEITEDLEFRFRRAFPQISRVNIHAEPRSPS